KSMKRCLQLHERLRFVMRVTMLNFILAGGMLGLAHATDLNAQVLEKPVSVDLENVSLRSALNRIGRAADVKFLYHSQLLAPSERVRVKVSDMPLAEVLDEILRPHHIQFEAAGNQIVLTREVMRARADAAIMLRETIQAIQVSGRVVSDQNEPLPGVNVLVKGTSQGTTTDVDGQFTLTVPDQNAVLVFSFIGYQTQEVTVGARTNINVTMASDTRTLDEVVVVGYGEMEKRDITGSVAQIKSEAIQAVPVYNVEQALKARAAGVQVTQNSGQPGGRIEVRIRGGNSMIGSNDPLYVVDGFPITGGMEFLN